MRAQSVYKILTTALVATVLTACSGSNNGADSGDSRVIWSNVAVKGITTSNFLLTLSATLLPPTIGANTLTANNVAVSGTNAYVSYNLPGATHMGAIDLLSVLVPALPVRTLSLSLPNATINDAYVYNNTLYAVGSNQTSWVDGSTAALNAVNIASGNLSLTSSNQLLSTYAGTGVSVWNGKLLSIGGCCGASGFQGMSVRDPSSLAEAQQISIVEPRDLSYYYGGGTNMWVVTGAGSTTANPTGTTTAKLLEIANDNTRPDPVYIKNSYTLGGNQTAESKSTVIVGRTLVAASKSEGGVAIMCQADGVVLKSLAAPTGVPGFTNAQTVSNGVAAGPGLLFVANGEAGVYVYTMTRALTSPSTNCAGINTTFIGTINLGDVTYSANNINYIGGSLFIASGLGGFKVVTVTVLSPLLNAVVDFM